MATIDDLLNSAAVVRDEDQEQENTAFRVGTLLVNVIQYLSSLITSEDANAAISDALADFFEEGALKQSALPPAFMSSLSDWAEGVAEKESTTHLLKLIHSRIILLDSMGSTLDGLDYTPVAGDLVWRTGYVWKYNGSEYEDGALPPKPHVVYVNKHTGKMYMWNGRAMAEVGNHYDDKIQISKMDETAIANIPAGKVHYIPSQSKLVYRISRDEWHSWTPRTDLIYIDISSNALYRWQGSSFQKVTSNSGSGGGSAGVSAFENYEAYESISALPGQGVATTGYIVGTHIYAYVNTGGDTKDGKYQDLGTLEAAGVSVTTTEDGTFTIHVGSDSYTVNLNHTHPNMCKLIVCEESDLPSTLDPATIYAITDSGETEIEKLIIRGMEFAGGGVPDTGEPVISSPSNGSTINLGTNEGSGVSKTITIKGKNLTGDLTVSVGTGLEISYGQTLNGSSVTIPMAQALLGAQVTISYAGSGALDDGSLVISHGGSVLSSVVVVVVVPVPVALTAIKLTGTQWLQTDYYPNPNTEFELDCLFEANANTDTVGGASANLSPYFLTCEHESDNRFNFQTGGVEAAGQHMAYRIACYNNTLSVRTEIDFANNYSNFVNRSILYYKKSGSNMNLTFQGVSASPAAPLKGNTMQSKLAIGYSYYFQKMFTRFNLSIYGFKIIENGTVVRYYVPAELNGVPGLHDTITDSFISSQTAADVIPIS